MLKQSHILNSKQNWQFFFFAFALWRAIDFHSLSFRHKLFIHYWWLLYPNLSFDISKYIFIECSSWGLWVGRSIVVSFLRALRCLHRIKASKFASMLLCVHNGLNYRRSLVFNQWMRGWRVGVELKCSCVWLKPSGPAARAHVHLMLWREPQHKLSPCLSLSLPPSLTFSVLLLVQKF